ncbi:peptidase MA family metallohydrolase [Anaeromyxobacter sp. SG17]|uniref:peptidase MA family metallohydrolase n=1 Tax=Anaeromyxobacter sp. SG17 TaxID=2925405 RepID=UPI001F563B11|nr:tetratricopeptide repeat protein [Anaeromyxobacter sp. SG17]
MRALALALVAALVAGSAPASAAPPAKNVTPHASPARPPRPKLALPERISGALRTLADEDVASARAVIEPLFAASPDEPAVRLAAGLLRFYEQRYAEAVPLVESSGLGDPAGYLALAKAALEVTKDDARFESEHFVVAYPKGKDEVLVPYLVDALERQRAALARSLAFTPDARLTVEIVNDVKELAKVSTLTEQEIRTSGTVAVCKFNKLMLLSPKALLKGYDWLDTAAHEYTHHVLTLKSRNRAPIWLQEGLAKWFEDDWRGGGEPISPVSAALVREAVQKNELVSFEEMHPSLAKLPSQERAALAYAQVALAIEYLVQQRGPPVLPRILDALSRGEPTEAAVSEALGVPFPRFLGEWRRHMGSRALPRGGEHALAKLRFKDDPKQAGQWAEWAEIPDERARGFARLGEIMRTRGKWTAARIEYGKAVQRVGARVPILSNQYALAAMMSGADGEAERVLREALGWSPDYAALHVRLARILLARKDFAGAKEHLLVANRQDPFDPDIHAGLAKALEASGDPGGASREAGFARILADH